MDSNDTKQIIIGFNAIEDSCKAMLKPIKINLNDTETAMKMSKAQATNLALIQLECEGIQTVLKTMEYHISELEESIYDDGEIEAAGKMIYDILYDVEPLPTKIPSQPAMDDLDTIAKLAGY